MMGALFEECNYEMLADSFVPYPIDAIYSKIPVSVKQRYLVRSGYQQQVTGSTDQNVCTNDETFGFRTATMNCIDYCTADSSLE